MIEFEIVRDMKSAMEEGYQKFLDEANDGIPSNALRYAFLNEALRMVEDLPHSNPLVQNLMLVSLGLELQRLEAMLAITTVNVSPN